VSGPIHVARHVDDLLNDVGLINVAILDLDHDGDVVSRAEVLLVLVRDFYERMILREQIAKAGNQFSLGCEVPEERRHHANHEQHQKAPPYNPFAKSIPDHRYPRRCLRSLTLVGRGSALA
jgi:hypothetical protein